MLPAPRIETTILDKTELVDGHSCKVEISTMTFDGFRVEMRKWVPVEQDLQRAFLHLQEQYYLLNDTQAVLQYGSRISGLKVK